MKSSTSPVGFGKTELLLELQEVYKDRTLLRSSSVSIGLASNLVWFNYADFSLIFSLLTQTNVTFCCFIFKTVNLLQFHSVFFTF